MVFEKIASVYSKSSPEQLRDAVVYDESIGSFELEENEELRYLGSFELSQHLNVISNKEEIFLIQVLLIL